MSVIITKLDDRGTVVGYYSIKGDRARWSGVEDRATHFTYKGARAVLTWLRNTRSRLFTTYRLDARS